MVKPTDPAVVHRSPAFAEAMTRLRAEFLEMPGLQLTTAQAARLCHLDPKSCEAVLTSLVEAKFLTRTRNHRFARA